MRKNRLTVLLSVVFLLASSFVSLADNVASASDAVYVHPEPLAWSDAVDAVKAQRAGASPSEADIMTMNLTDEDYGVMPLSSLGSVSNTVDRTAVYVKFLLQNGAYRTTYIDSVGDIVGKTFDSPIVYFEFQFPSLALPPTGTYSFSFDFSSTFSYTVEKSYFYAVKNLDNAQNQQAWSSNLPISQSSGDLYLSNYVIDINRSNSHLGLRVYPSDSDLCNFDASVSFNFTKSSSESSFSSIDVSSAESQEVYQAEVSSSLGSIGDTLEEIVATISLQLEALWNQMYNYMHLPEYNKLEEIRQAIENIDLDLDIDFDAVVAKIQEQISNDNANTEKVTNGYDNSDINYENDRLSGALGRLSDTEHDVTDSASGHLDSFDFDDSFFADYIKPLEDISYFLSGIYVALGGLNIPIGFTLTLTIALLLIGYYRFKGGS